MKIKYGVLFLGLLCGACAIQEVDPVESETYFKHTILNLGLSITLPSNYIRLTDDQQERKKVIELLRKKSNEEGVINFDVNVT